MFIFSGGGGRWLSPGTRGGSGRSGPSLWGAAGGRCQARPGPAPQRIGRCRSVSRRARIDRWRRGGDARSGFRPSSRRPEGAARPSGPRHAAPPQGAPAVIGALQGRRLRLRLWLCPERVSARLPGAGCGLYRKHTAGRAEKAECPYAGGDGVCPRPRVEIPPAGGVWPGLSRRSWYPPTRLWEDKVSPPPPLCRVQCFVSQIWFVLMENSLRTDREGVRWERIFKKSFRKRVFIKRACLDKSVLRHNYKIAAKHHKGSVWKYLEYSRIT